MNHTRTNQGGSVAPFVVVGIVLLVLFGGGIYLLRQHADSNPPVPVGVSPSTEPVEEPSATPAPSSPSLRSPQPSTSPSPSPEASEVSSGESDLPRTGPAETASSGIALAVLTAAVVSYVRSRQAPDS